METYIFKRIMCTFSRQIRYNALVQLTLFKFLESSLAIAHVSDVILVSISVRKYDFISSIFGYNAI